MKKNIEVLTKNNGVKDEFNDLLDSLNIPYTAEDSHLLIGNHPNANDTVIFVSIIASQINNAIREVIPIAYNKNITSRVIKNVSLANANLGGQFGYENIGKIIALYFPKDYTLADIIRIFSHVTSNFSGPEIPNHVSLGGRLYCSSFVQYDGNMRPNLASKKFNILHDKYITTSKVKSSAKGDIFKGFYFKGFLQTESVIIKQGKECMCSDAYGRDINDRLKWQMQLHQDLPPVVNVPRYIDFFEVDGDSYLVLEYINGSKLLDEIKKIYSANNWCSLRQDDRLRLLDIVLLVLNSIAVLHSTGLIHRDLSPVNFMLTKKGKLYLIDLELAYSLDKQYPDPPFAYGTPGYMSQEQKMGLKPSVKEDIFAIGALMILFFTGIQPLKFDQSDLKHLKQNLLFLTRNPRITKLITGLLNQDPNKRLTIAKVIEILTEERKYYEEKEFLDRVEPELPRKSEVVCLLNRAYGGLFIPEMTENNAFFSVMGQFDNRIGNSRITDGYGLGFQAPISAVLFLLFNYDDIRLSPNADSFLKDYLNTHIDFVKNHQANNQSEILTGMTGKGLIIYYCKLLGIFSDTSSTNALIENCFDHVSNHSSFFNGLAGQLVGAILIYDNNPSKFFEVQIIRYAELLINRQDKEGSWQDLDQEMENTLSLGSGVSGIIIALIMCDKRFSQAAVRIAIVRAVGFIVDILKKNWNRLNQKIDNGSLVNGVPGIALMLIYAYNHLADKSLKELFEKLLLRLPRYPLLQNYSLANGIIGLGIVYIKAMAINDNKEWKSRIAWIYKLLINTVKNREDDVVSWNIYGMNEFEYDSGILTGVGGVVLFLAELSNLLSQSTYRVTSFE